MLEHEILSNPCSGHITCVYVRRRSYLTTQTYRPMYSHTAADTGFVPITEVKGFHLVERLTNFKTLNKVLVINQSCQHQNTHRFITGLVLLFYSSLSLYVLSPFYSLTLTHSHMYVISLILPPPLSVLLTAIATAICFTSCYHWGTLNSDQNFSVLHNTY